VKRAEKEKLAEELKKELSVVKSIFLIDFRGLKTNELNNLRKKIREASSRYRVIKNRLIRKALTDSENQGILQHVDGPTSFAYTQDDPIPLAKVLVDFSKESPELKLKAGFVDNAPLSIEEIKELARITGREDLVSKMCFILNSPLVGLIRVLRANQQNLAMILKQIADKKS
jgi:large subunit ribosomal protein L10